MTISDDDIILTSPVYNPPNHEGRIGGENSRNEISFSEVNSIFMPGMIKNVSDFSDINYYQYSKIFVFNKNHEDTAYDFRIYGFNINRNNIVEFALERDNNGDITLDGEESTKDRETEPDGLTNYSFAEVHSDNAIFCGGDGDLGPRQGQGVWLRMHCDSSDTAIPTDTFSLRIKYNREDVF